MTTYYRRMRMTDETDDSWKGINMGGALILLTFLYTWLAGVALAQGFASTFLAAVFPPWAWYLFTFRALSIFGWIPT